MPSLRWQLDHSNGDGGPAPEKRKHSPDSEAGSGGDVAGPSGTADVPAAIVSIPAQLPSKESALASFLAKNPRFECVGETREAEFPHLAGNAARACFDYCGFGLFTSSPRQPRSDFALAAAATGVANLPATAAYGGADAGTLEAELRHRVLDYLNVGDGYRLVFAASKRAAFGLLGAAYDFSTAPRLLSVYDHDSESVRGLSTAARAAGARTSAAAFRWPELQICGGELAAALKGGGKRRRRRCGLFVFPTQSRITGTKYSYQWMTMADKHNWDVLLDVSAMGPKDMGSLGLSLFRPDFIVCSFYKVFGADPTGFGCLLIKDSSLGCLKSSPVAGIVRIVPLLAASSPEGGGDCNGEEGGEPKHVIAFSGPVLGSSPTSSSSGSFAFHHMQPQSTTSSELGQLEPQEEEEEEEKHSDGEGDKQKKPFESEIEEEVEEHSKSSVVSEHRNGSMLLQPSSSSAAAGEEDDAAFRRISRDEGLIDSRRSDMFRRFLPIREDIEEVQPEMQMPAVGIQEGSKRNSSSWDDEYYYDYDEDYGSEGWEEDAAASEPLIVCRGLDLASSLGLNKTNIRIKCLMEWLINSMGSLVHRIPIVKSKSGEASTSSSKEWKLKPLVQIFGPKSQPDRGPAIAFNMYDRKGNLVDPSTVQKLADRAGISLGLGCLSNVFLEESEEERMRRKRIPEKCSNMVFLDHHHHHSGHRSSSSSSRMKRMSNTRVVTATLGLVSNFDDVYRLWAFAAKFLDPEFMGKEVLRYQSLNQETVVVGAAG